MEVIGAISAIVALAETTGKLAKGLKKLAVRWKNAPEEIQSLAETTDRLAIKLVFVRDTVASSQDALMDDIIRQGLLQLVREAEMATEELERLEEKLEQCGSFLQRTKWAVKDARTVKGTLSKVSNVEEGLSKWIDYISLKGHTSTLQQIEATRRTLLTGIDQTQQLFMVKFQEMEQRFAPGMASWPSTGTSSPSLQQAPILMSGAAPSTTSRSAPSALVRRVWEGNPWNSGERWQSWGLRGTVIKSTQGQHTDYDASFTIHLPLAWLIGAYSLNGQLSFRTSPLRQNTLTLRHPSYFTVARIVDSSHPFMMACLTGDLDTVRALLNNGEGRPTDKDENGDSPMLKAIVSGSVEVVVELLNHGVDVDDGAVGLGQHTALELAATFGKIDTMRLLLRRGASQDHMDNMGFGVHSICWVATVVVGACSADIFRLLGEHAMLEMRSSFGSALTVLHGAAAFAGAADVLYLIQLGLDVNERDIEGTTPLQYAVESGNPPAYFALLSYEPGLVANVHESGRSLLHRVVAGKHAATGAIHGDYDPIIRDLLSRGEDPLMRNMPEHDFEFPESVRSQSITPQQLAAAYGPDIEGWFMAILRDCGVLNAREDIDRLHELEKQGYASQGHVIGEEQSQSENEAEVKRDDRDEEGLDHNGSAIDVSESEDEDHFWDAEDKL
ncbi:hypothetical protein Q7P37_009207 [Cladosporium fusiforme]